MSKNHALHPQIFCFALRILDFSNFLAEVWTNLQKITLNFEMCFLKVGVPLTKIFQLPLFVCRALFYLKWSRLSHLVSIRETANMCISRASTNKSREIRSEIVLPLKLSHLYLVLCISMCVSNSKRKPSCVREEIFRIN